MLTAQQIVDDIANELGWPATDGAAGRGVIEEEYPAVYGGALRFWNSTAHEVILHGPYETGKTFAVLTKLHKLMNEHPGAQALMVRKTYQSLLGSAVVTYRTKVLPRPLDDPQSTVHAYGGERPEFFIYDNGSRIWLGGLDHAGKFLSAEFDYIYINQAEEIDLADYETLTGRATGRAGHTDSPQIMCDCNPGPPDHWILKRASAGDCELIQQMHEDNPTLFDQRTYEITERGKVTMQVLDRLTGTRYLRGRLGLWVQAEGAIFDNFSLEHNVTEEADYHPGWLVRWGCDDGYAEGAGPGNANYHPRVILLGQVTPQGGLNVFYEYYATNEIPETSIRYVLDKSAEMGWDEPDIAYVDSAAGALKITLGDMLSMYAGATHPVSEGIKNVRRLICDGQGVRLLKIHPRCVNLIREMQSYRYDENSRVANVGEPKPLKLDDHGPDALRYMTWDLRYAD